MTPPRLLRACEAARYLSIGRDAFAALVREGRIDQVKLTPRTVRYDVRQLDRMVDELRGVPAEPQTPEDLARAALERMAS